MPVLRSAAIFLVLLCIGCGGGGGGGNTSGSSTQPPVASTSIKLGDTFRQIAPGDLTVWNVDIGQTARDSAGAVIGTGSESTTVDFEYFSSNAWEDILGGTTPEEISVFRQQASFGNGTIISSVLFQVLETGSIYTLVEDDGAFILTIGNEPEDSFAGLAEVPMRDVAAGTSYDFEYAVIDPREGQTARGTRSITVSSPETIQTPLARIEAWRITIIDDREELGSFGSDIETQYVIWFHPDIGLIRQEIIETVVEAFGEATETELAAVLRSVNFNVPAATPD